VGGWKGREGLKEREGEIMGLLKSMGERDIYYT